MGVLGLHLIVVFSGILRVIEKYLVDNELSEDLAIQSILLKFEIEILNVSIPRLILFLVKVLEIRVLKSLLST